MKVQITEVRENPLLERKEVRTEIDHSNEKTPSKSDLKDRISANNDLDSDKVEVESIYTGYGNNISLGILKIYDEFEYDEDLKKSEEEEDEGKRESNQETISTEYEELVSGTITEAKDTLNEMDDPDYEAALKAEKDNKNRTTLIDWLENKI